MYMFVSVRVCCKSCNSITTHFECSDLVRTVLVRLILRRQHKNIQLFIEIDIKLNININLKITIFNYILDGVVEWTSMSLLRRKSGVRIRVNSLVRPRGIVLTTLSLNLPRLQIKFNFISIVSWTVRFERELYYIQ